MEIFPERNSIALATSVVARVRNKSLSVLAYRISSIIFHSGTSHQDIIHLNRLGVCMSPDRIINLERSMGKNFDSKALFRKKELEKKQSEIGKLALRNEIEEKLLPKLEEDDMELEVLIDLSENNLKDYRNYKPDLFLNVIQVMELAKTRHNTNEFTGEVLKHPATQKILSSLF